MKFSGGNSVDAQSFRHSWQSLLKVSQGSVAPDARNSAPAYEESVSLEDSGSSNQTRFSERSTQTPISGIRFQSAFAPSASRLRRSPQSVRGNRMDSAPEPPVAASASSRLPNQKPLKAATRDATSHFQKPSPDKNQPSARVQLAAAADTNLPVSHSWFGHSVPAPSAATAPPTSKSSRHLHMERSDSTEESLARTLGKAGPTSDSALITSASKSTPKADTLVPAEPQTLASGPVTSGAVLDAVIEGRRSGRPIQDAAGTAAAPFITINQGAKREDPPPADRSTDLETLGSDGLNLSASVHERTAPRAVQTSSPARAAADKSATSGVLSRTAISGGGALHEDQIQHFPAASISLQSGPQFATESGIESAVSTARRRDAVREPFITLDAGPTQVPFTWTLAGTHRAEAGFQDPSLGWVTVRAQEAAGGIHATLVPATADAAQVLASHLAGLNTYMASESAHVNPITLSAPDADGTATDSRWPGEMARVPRAAEDSRRALNQP